MKATPPIPRDRQRWGLIALWAVAVLAVAAVVYTYGSALLAPLPTDRPPAGPDATPSPAPTLAGPTPAGTGSASLEAGVASIGTDPASLETSAAAEVVTTVPAAAASTIPAAQAVQPVDVPTTDSGALDRPADPVILTGADVPGLAETAPGELVAWRYDGGWQQVPVQVDERAMLDLGQVSRENLNRWQQERSQALLYTDPDTLTGPDPETLLDADDEIVFMARDAGRQVPAGAVEPPGVIPGSGIAVAISDPVDGREGYVYLFWQDGTLDPGAGQSYVDYRFHLLSGDYLTTYQFEKGTNPEDSVIATPYYRGHFADRWVQDELHILAGEASGVDILDRHKTRLAPDNCMRTENTFSKWGGGFVVNKSGPVRAIRSYIGANSGRFTQRTHLFYDRRQDIVSTLRVHEVPGLIDLFDYSPEAAGMVYANNLNLAGVVIDGEPDRVITGTLEWEMVAGPQGGLAIVHRLETGLTGFSLASYYLDEVDPGVMRRVRCTGDQVAYGTSGPWWTSTLASTDVVTSAEAALLEMTRTLYYEGPDLAVARVEALSAAARAPMAFATQPWHPAAP